MNIFVSVIIPVYNDTNGLNSTVNSLIEQDIDPTEYEIIIADNGSNDGTKELALEIQSRYPERVKVVHEDKIQGSYAARTKGLRIALGDLYCFLDADVTVEHDFLSKVVALFHNGPVDYLGCNVKMRLVKNTLAAKYNYIRGFGVRKAIEKDKYTPTCCLIIRCGVMEKVGNFDHRVEGGGDFEFGERVHEAGFYMDYAEDIIVYHPTRWKYSSLITKAKRVGRGNAELAHYYPDKYRYLYTRHFTIKKFLPRNPVSFHRRMKKEDIPVSWLAACLLGVYHLPIGMACAIAAHRRARELRSSASPITPNELSHTGSVDSNRERED